jgi:hypothetical protein
MRDTRLHRLSQVWLDEPGAVGRLLVQGTIRMLPPVPFEGMGLGGCSWLSTFGDAALPQIAKLHARPL